MCGIAGILAAEGSRPEREALKRMASVMTHRGPDDEGIAVFDRVGLVHRRLTIIDLTETGRQPMGVPGRDIHIAFNGEVYNFQPLRAKLAAAGHTFRGTSDTEVILHAYIEWGTAAFEKFDGMFAFAILDRERQRLVLARDRTGIKPLVTARHRGALLFASEVKAILAAGFPPDLDDCAVGELILAGHTEGKRTFFRGIEHLPAGCFLEVDLRDGKSSLVRYHDLHRDVTPERYRELASMPDEEVRRHAERVLTDSVRMHLIADVPVGTLCSGGVDSSLVTALALREQPQVHIFHAAVGDGLGEQEYAAEVAKHLGISIDYFTLRRDIYLESLASCVAQSEMPLYHPNDIPLYHICRVARERGIKVLLAGEGADELFGGYPWFRAAVRHLRRLRWFRLLPKKLGAFIARNFARFLYDDGDLALCHTYSDPQGLVRRVSFLLGQGERGRRYQRSAETYAFLSDPVERHGLGYLFDHLFGHLDSILISEDRMGMLASVELRVPFLENHVIDLALNLPLKHKCRGNETKHLLKKVAEAHIPRRNVYRKKMGFPAPWQDYLWMPQSLFERGFCEEYLGAAFADLKTEAEAFPDIAWALVNLELFGRIFFRGEDPQELTDRMARREAAAPVPAAAPAAAR